MRRDEVVARTDWTDQEDPTLPVSACSAWVKTQMHDAMQKMATVGIDEVVAHSDRPDYVASKDPELRMWDALDAGTHDGTLQDAMLEHMQVSGSLPHLTQSV